MRQLVISPFAVMNRLNRFSVVAIVVVSLLSVGLAAASAKPKKGGGGGSGGDEGNSAVPAPTTAPNASNSQVTQDLADLKAAETAVEETFETSSEWLNAQAAVKQAQTDYEDSCGPVMDALKLQPAYQSAADAQAKADANLKDLQTTGSQDDISSAAQTAMAARSTVKGMESKALLSDPGTVAAKQRLTAANAAVAQLKQKEQDAVHTDPTWLDAKKKLDAARGH